MRTVGGQFFFLNGQRKVSNGQCTKTKLFKYSLIAPLFRYDLTFDRSFQGGCNRISLFRPIGSIVHFVGPRRGIHAISTVGTN